MKINTKIRYGIRTMVELALAYDKEGILQKDISERQEISLKYLDQIISSLKASGLIIKNTGRNGGYSLARKPDQITIYDIYKAFESNLMINDCIGDHEACYRKRFCAVVDFWESLNNQIIQFMESTNLQELAVKQLNMNKKSDELMFFI